MTRVLYRLSTILFIALGCGLLALEGSAMSLFKGEEVCLFSGFSGIVTFDGKPAAGAKLIRTVSWKDDDGQTDEVVASDSGEFSFEPIWTTRKASLLAQFVAHQSIRVSYDGEVVQIWGAGKMSTAEYSEFGGPPKNLRCELKDPIRRIEPGELGEELVGTSCYWEVNSN